MIITDCCYKLRGRSTLVTDRHTHDAIEFILIDSGEGMILKDNRSYAISKSSLCIIDARKQHVINPTVPDEYQRSKIIIDAPSFFAFCAALGLSDRFVSALLNAPPISTSAIPEVERIFLDVHAVYGSGDADSLALAHSHIIELMRIAASSKDGVRDVSTNKVVQSILDHIHERGGVSSLAEISNQLHFSRYYLCHLFKEKIGISLSGYLNEKRFEKCASLLSESDMSIGEIATACGFDYVSSFTRFFKQQSGMSPLAYRRKNERQQ